MSPVRGYQIVRIAALTGLLFLSAQAEAELLLDPSFGVNGVVRTAFGTCPSRKLKLVPAAAIHLDRVAPSAAQAQG